VTSAAGNQGVRLAELLATVSLASDLAHDVPAESALRDAVLAARLARLAGWSEPEVDAGNCGRLPSMGSFPSNTRWGGNLR